MLNFSQNLWGSLVILGKSLTMAHSSALVQEIKEIKGLAFWFSEGLMLKRHVLIRSEEKERVLEQKESFMKELVWGNWGYRWGGSNIEEKEEDDIGKL